MAIQYAPHSSAFNVFSCFFTFFTILTNFYALLLYFVDDQIDIIITNVAGVFL